MKRFEVEIQESLDEIDLVVNDLGRGFDVDAAVHSRGLGLTSMQERVRLVKGNIEIHAKRMSGTTIHVRVPFKSDPSAQRAAG